jgi:hypothetical protein
MGSYDLVAPTDEIVNDYFHWLCSLVHADDPDESYICLMEVLFEREFTWIIDMDENRAMDGLDLRKDFKQERSYSNYLIFDAMNCSVLETLIALSIRIDEEIMWNPDRGERYISWFWEMIDNLELGGFDDFHFDFGLDREVVEGRLDIFLDRKYDKNGVGSLFPMKNLLHFYNQKCNKAVKSVTKYDIWHQMSMYFLSKYGVEDV